MSKKPLIFSMFAILLFISISSYGQNKDGFGSVDNHNETHRLRHDFSAHFGLSSIVSKMYVDGDKYTWRVGKEISIQYHYMFQDDWGLGFTYDRNLTDYPGADVDQSFIGLSIAYRNPISRRWNLGGGLDIGRATCDDSEQETKGVGIKTRLGLEYLLSKNIGVSLDAFSALALLHKKTTIPSDNNNGIGRVGLQLGLHLHL